MAKTFECLYILDTLFMVGVLWLDGSTLTMTKHVTFYLTLQELDSWMPMTMVINKKYHGPWYFLIIDIMFIHNHFIPLVFPRKSPSSQQ